MRDILAEQEQNKYERMWQIQDYRKVSVGDRYINLIPKLTGVQDGGSIIDFGCGTGRTAKLLKNRGYKVTGLDHAKNCLDRNVDIEFKQVCLWDIPSGVSGECGVCTDVMEHIPEEKVDAVLACIKKCVPVCFFAIDDAPDLMGNRIGERLHMTVKPMSWWQNKLKDHFNYVQGYHDRVFLVRSV